jgi:hypothetical protein
MSADEIKLFNGPWTEELLAKLPEQLRDIIANKDGIRDKCTVVYDHYETAQAAEQMIDQLVNEDGWIVVEKLDDRTRLERRST